MINWLVPPRQTNDSLANKHEKRQALPHGFTYRINHSEISYLIFFFNPSFTFFSRVCQWSAQDV